MVEELSHLEGSQRNRYLVMRHGQSTANVAGVIVSHPGVQAFETAGLTPVGRDQAKASGLACGLGSDVVIVTSDFARASQTAAIVAEVLSASNPSVDVRLRERNFGSLEGASAENYQRVWNGDANNDPFSDVENVQSVLDRTLALISDLEIQFTGRTILLVAHGDTLQILQTAFAGVPASAHRSLPPLGNAEIRQLSFTG